MRDGFQLTGSDRPADQVGQESLFSTRRWTGVKTRSDYLVPSTPYYADNLDAVDLANFDGLSIRLVVGKHAERHGMDHLYQNGLERKSRDVPAIAGDKGEGHVRDLLATLRNANQKFSGAKHKITLRNGLTRKAVVLQKRNDKNGGEFWSVITTVPAQQKDIVNCMPFPITHEASL